MMDLVILLSISLAVTALLGLLLIGFVWAPWLIGLGLLVLLIALMKITSTNEPQSELQSVVSLEQAGIATSDQTSQQDEMTSDEPVMVYRGVKYKRLPEDQPANDPSATMTQGKYRGQQWSR